MTSIETTEHFDDGIPAGPARARRGRLQPGHLVRRSQPHPARKYLLPVGIVVVAVLASLVVASQFVTQSSEPAPTNAAIETVAPALAAPTQVADADEPPAAESVKVEAPAHAAATAYKVDDLPMLIDDGVVLALNPEYAGEVRRRAPRGQAR